MYQIKSVNEFLKSAKDCSGAHCKLISLFLDVDMYQGSTANASEVNTNIL